MIRRRFKAWLKVKRLINQVLDKLALVADASRISTTELVLMLFEFCELSSGIKMFPYQEQFSKRIIRSVLENDGEEITALFARQSGKSETVATTTGGLMLILPQLANLPMFADDPRLKMFKDGMWIGIFAPTQRQAQITYNRIRNRIMSKSARAVMEDPQFRLTFTTSNGQTVAISNGSYAMAISASEGSNIEGETFKLILCEEAQDISNYKIRKSIHPMGAAYNASIIKIGTATNHKGDFYEAIQRNKRDLELRKIKATDYMRRNHFEYSWQVVVKYNEKYARYVEKEKQRLGEKSDEFRMSYCLEWILERGMFTSIEFVEKNCLEPNIGTRLSDLFMNHVAGIDIGGKGDDSTVVTITEVDWSRPVISEMRKNEETGEDEMYFAYNTYIKAWLEIRNVPDYEDQYFIIKDFLSKFRISRVVCDTTRESAIADRLRANTNYEVISYVFTQKSKSDLYKHLDRELTSGRARIPADMDTIHSPEYSKFIEQLVDLQKGYSGQYLVVSHPAEKGAHDDFPDSWALSVWGCGFEGGMDTAQTYRNTFTQKTRNEIMFGRSINRLTGARR
jgi:hypothetical protein